MALSDEEQGMRCMVLSGLCNLFDEDGNNTVDLMEVVSGLTILCGDSQDEKAEATFRLYDYNGNGVISLEEMTGYLTSVFKIMYHAKEGTAEHMGVSATRRPGLLFPLNNRNGDVVILLEELVCANWLPSSRSCTTPSWRRHTKWT